MAPKENRTFQIDAEAIRELAALMEETGLTEIEVTEGERAIRVGRGQLVSAAPAHHPHAVSQPHAPASPLPAAPAPAAALTATSPGVVASPMVGTAYLKPDPGSPPFVAVGASVSVGDTLLIIEAMKVMNPIKAAKAGKVTQIVVGDSQPVEFGEVLLVIE